jgi:alpha-tubulin suppressor-like RCC1 family protein
LVDGTVYSVGRNNRGQLGRSGTTTEWGATTLSGVIAIADGFLHCYALTSGKLYAVGSNGSGQFGLGDTTDRSEWTESVITPE